LEKIQKGKQKNKKEQYFEQFTEAISNYCHTISKDYNQSPGDDEDLNTPVDKIIEIYKKCPVSLKYQSLFSLLRIMTSPSKDDSLTACFCQLSNKLVTRLLEIK
jgi:hypothetical protein